MVLAVVGVGLVSATISKIMSGKPPPAKMTVHEVRIVRVPPPPPPPDQPPPPPEEVDVPEPEQQPEPTPSDEPPPGDLGLDAEGVAGGDSFGLNARPGGRDLVGSAKSQLTWYAGLVQSAILAELNNEKLSRSRAYSVPIKVWVREDGSIEKTELGKSTGDGEVDRAIEKALARVVRIPYAAPAQMPQPMTVRLVARV
ncbi:MAG: TonB C-terminal domain-containing protein [Myxococcales bacterium]|nr:TonB C-terminal domain-containing protein [Myxococcales bacterium]